jgi:hypothetical protein
MTQNELKRLLAYDPDTGIFRWRIARGRAVVGGIAGAKNGKGYWTIKIEWIKYQAHRLAWLYMTGEWPVDQIDHINMDRADNTWSNLRAATNAQNQANSLKKSNTSGLRGVHWAQKDKKWIAQIQRDYRKVRLGAFDTPEEARAVYLDAAWEAFGEYAR